MCELQLEVGGSSLVSALKDYDLTHWLHEIGAIMKIKRMVCAHSLLWLGAFLYYTKIWIYSGTSRHVIWPDVYLLPDHTVPLTHQHHKEEQLHEVHDTWWTSAGEMWHITSIQLRAPGGCHVACRRGDHLTGQSLSMCFWALPQTISDPSWAYWSWSFICEFYLMKVQNSCYELLPS